MKAIVAVLARTALLVLTAGACWQGADAGDFPQRPIRFILGFGTAGPTDVIARTLADQLSKDLAQRVIVENRPGASGNIATQAVALADADGYTYLVGATPFAVNHSLFPDFPVQFGKDLMAIAPVGANANVLVARPSLHVSSVAGLIKRARMKANGVTYATVGLGSSSHLAGVALDLRAGTTMLPVSYRGGGEALKDLLSGRVDAWFAPVPSVLGAIQSGQLLALATTAPQRVAQLPDVPTMVEMGFPGFDIRLWVGLFARTGVPADAVSVMRQAVARAMASTEFQTALETQGITTLAMSPAEFSAFVAEDIKHWQTVVAAIRK